MRGCHSHDHSTSNEEQWSKPLSSPVIVPNPDFIPPTSPMSNISDWAWAEWVEAQGIGE